MSARILKLTDLGQSLWLDYMERMMLQNGELASLIDQGDIRGLTSNPSIFNHAIANSKDYDSALIPMSWAGYTDKQILEQLMVEDIVRVADLLRPLFDRTHGGDGFVSLEVRPHLAYDTEKTIHEAQRLWDLVNRPNVMIKIPGTEPGLLAIRRSIAAGINVNITLLFSVNRYQEVMDAYLSGLEDRVNEGKPIDHIHSVASFFVSRIDVKVDKYLEPLTKSSGDKAQKAKSLLGKLAIANARLAYQEFRKVFEGERFQKLHAKGATLQRTLWASTSTKNPDYPDTMYVDELIGEHTVNTVPPQTLNAFRDHGTVQRTIEKDLDKAHQQFKALEELGISMDKVTQELEEEGVKAFSESYDSLDASVKQRRETALADLGPLTGMVSKRVKQLESEDYIHRFYAKDATLWTDDPKKQEEVGKRMGWVTAPVKNVAVLPELIKYASQVKSAGLTHALLLGMGGSSLAAEVMSLIFQEHASGLKLSILDSTDPTQIQQAALKHPTASTLFIVSSKSGTTAEVEALFNYFWERSRLSLGDKASDHFIAITDPGTPLEKLAFEHKFHKIFLADPNVGGRYSALTAFGLVPAALMGIDLSQLISCASWMADECAPDKPYARNPGLVLGAIIAEATLHGRGKLTIIADPEVSPFGAWLEQLVAESSGKQGKGILPIDGEVPAAPGIYGNDRLFIYLRRSGKFDQEQKLLLQAGHPVINQDFEDDYALGSEFFKWEFAVATACSIIGVDAFNQPDVQDSKTRTVKKITYYKEHRSFQEAVPQLTDHGISVNGNIASHDGQLTEIVNKALGLVKPGDYIAINAYLARDPQNEAMLQTLRSWIREKTHLATTLGFGPRFQHSTGQLHKGGENNGLFLVITANSKKDIDIPEEGLSFGTMEHGQALGDMEALENRDRKVLHIHLDNPDLLSELVRRITQ
jgi:transaldolase / glucose-6-phosphate isomerase